MKSIYNFDIDSMINILLEHQAKKYHAVELFTWLYQKRIKDFNEITNIKKEIISKIEEEYSLDELNIVKKEEDIDVSKYLFKLKDGEHIEAVLMRHDYGNSICISSQVGCNMGCHFCESGRRKKVRNLETYEMVLQVLQIEEDIKCRISHVVIMGIGEPFDNYNNVITFLKVINDPKGMAIGARHITVSTCGIIPKIKEFMKLKLQVNLAISLHAPNDELRNRLMPINKVYPLKDLIPVLKEYIKNTGRRLTFEYILLNGVNDNEKCAIELANLIKGMNAYVNLIPYNETENIQFNRSKTIQIMKFYDILKKNKIGVTIRKEFGTGISAACGQLRSREEQNL